ncbi:MAG: 50S ribosomal protein L9 [Alphaproteobacteria bacterium CG11_big_fil_rev_8_21_14_0_20_44_7]|nr:MAG: 50S ribosomal protein L9 [Alphaproteobacteria bacterium CG11_big_fil_rev_8_21_14_0_20_44_7]
MEVVLLEPVAKLGKIGEIVTVKNGYARNYLIPRGAALRANKENIAIFEEKKKEIEAKNDDKKKAAEALAKKLDGVTVTIIRQAAEDGRLYGSVTVREISEHIRGDGFEVDSKSINLLNPIRSVGAYDVTVSLYAEVDAKIKVNVARSESEAENQLSEELDAEKAEREAQKQASVEGAIRAAEAAKKAAEQAEKEAAEASESEEAEANEEE